jgi:hypothetical protein
MNNECLKKGCVNSNPCINNGYNTMQYFYNPECHPQFIATDGVGNPLCKLVEIRKPVLVEFQKETYVPPAKLEYKKFGSRCGKCRQGCRQYGYF